MRILLYLLVVQAFLSCTTPSPLSPRPEPKNGFSILQGSTTESTALFRIVYPKALKMNYQVIDRQERTLKVKRVRSFTRKHSVFKVDHLKVSGLMLNERYSLKVTSDDKKWRDERYFEALDTKKKDMSILIASCMSDTFNEVGNDMWPKAFSHKPDVSFLIGDNIYADIFSGLYLGNTYLVNPDHLWNRYVDHAIKLRVNRMKNLTPTYVTWDDHDYGKNNGGREYPYKKEAKEMLNIFFPREKASNFKFGPGVSSVVEFSGMNFLFLDGRSFRSAGKSPDGPHFGKAQRRWIRRNLSANKINWLVGGDQFFGGYHPFESFQGDHPQTFKQFLGDIKKSKSKVIFISGDRHLVEVMKIPTEVLGYETFEYTVSGIQSMMYPGSLASSPNPYRVGGFDGIANYAVLKTSKTESAVKVTFEAYSKSGRETVINQNLSLQ